MEDKAQPAPEDDHTEDDEVQHLDRELAVANDLTPGDPRRDKPGTAPGDAP